MSRLSTVDTIVDAGGVSIRGRIPDVLKKLSVLEKFAIGLSQTLALGIILFTVPQAIVGHQFSAFSAKGRGTRLTHHLHQSNTGKLRQHVLLQVGEVVRSHICTLRKSICCNPTSHKFTKSSHYFSNGVQ